MHYLENTLALYRNYAQQNQKLANKQTNKYTSINLNTQPNLFSQYKIFQ